MRKALVTGYSGFIGSYMAPYLRDKGYNVLGTLLPEENVESQKDIQYRYLDIRSQENITNILRNWRPDLVVHLAAQSMVIPSWQDTKYTLETNIFGTLYLLESIKKEAPEAIVLLASSSAQYGLTKDEEIPIKEDKVFRPTSPYAASKVAAEALAYSFFLSRGIKIVFMRFFNVTGPGKAGDACADFASGIAALEKQGGGTLEVGNTDTVRDISDVRDVVEAINILADKGLPGEAYNVCSGKGKIIKDILSTLKDKARLPIQVRHDLMKDRPFDEPVLIGSNKKISDLGWKPKIKFDQTLQDMLDYWRAV